jgi:hypothetical protein
VPWEDRGARLYELLTAVPARVADVDMLAASTERHAALSFEGTVLRRWRLNYRVGRLLRPSLRRFSWGLLHQGPFFALL